MMQTAIRDILEGLAWHEFWRTFAASDIVTRYRRSRLGQLWITLSVAIFVFVIGGLYRQLFSAGGTYLAYLAVGYILWLFIADIMNKGCTLFLSNQALLQNAPVPLSALGFRLVLTEVYVFAHHILILPVVFLVVGHWPDPAGVLQALLGLIMVVYTAFWVALLLGILALRFRDLAPIVQSLTRLLFFATPVLWRESDLGGSRALISTLNPARHFLTTVRAPLLDDPVGGLTYAICLAIATALTVVTLATLGWARHRIVYWL